MRRAVVALARTHEFARRLANTGRMAQANAYPPSPWAPEGARSLQNVDVGDDDGHALLRRRHALPRPLDRGQRCRSRAARTGREALAAVVRGDVADGDVARQLGAAPAPSCWCGPMPMSRRELVAPTAANVEAALRRAMSLETRTP